MSPRLLVWFVGWLAMASSGCWRTHVYAITEADAAPATHADTRLAMDADAKPTVDTETKPAVDADAAIATDADARPAVDADAALAMDADAALATDADAAPAMDADAKPAIVCPTSVLKSGNSNLTLKVGSVTRSYVLHVPPAPAYDGKKPVPLIVDFHGMPSSGAEELASSTYPSVTDSEGVVMAFPEGLSNSLGRGWNFGPCCVAGADDLGFAKALVAHLQTIACIDPDRVYAVGTLTGSGMVYLLACQAADIFAAVAPAAFDLIEETVSQCRPSRPITVISFRGTADTHVPYNGGESNLVPGMGITFLGAKKTFSTWGQLDGCTDTPAEDSRGCSRYSKCKGGVEVNLCTKKDGKEEPGDASIAWPILKRYTR